MVLEKKSKCLLSPRYVVRWCCMYENRLCRLLKRHFNKFAFLQRGSLMILLKNSKYLSSLNFCKRDLGFAVWCCCFHKRRLFNPRTYMQIHTRSTRGVDGPLPPRSFWFVAVFRNDFTFSGWPLIFLTRWGILYGWWRCWGPVTSPTIIAILDFTKNHQVLKFCPLRENSEKP